MQRAIARQDWPGGIETGSGWASTRVTPSWAATTTRASTSTAPHRFRGRPWRPVRHLGRDARADGVGAGPRHPLPRPRGASIEGPDPPGAAPAGRRRRPRRALPVTTEPDGDAGPAGAPDDLHRAGRRIRGGPTIARGRGPTRDPDRTRWDRQDPGCPSRSRPRSRSAIRTASISSTSRCSPIRRWSRPRSPGHFASSNARTAPRSTSCVSTCSSAPCCSSSTTSSRSPRPHRWSPSPARGAAVAVS